jgi:kynureninase
MKAELEYAREQDQKDALKNMRKNFHIPQHKGQDCVYFCGNSLGLQPKSIRREVAKHLKAWENHGVEGHFKDGEWAFLHRETKNELAKIVGALPHEVVAMNTLTVNLHLLMVSFYRPTKKRFKIIMEGRAFSSDQYAVETQVKFHGFKPEDAVIELLPRAGEYTLRKEDILKSIEEAGDSLALVMIGGVNYYTGQLFDMESITQKAHQVGAKVGFDLAHAAGNVPLNLHNWGVDFAAWCSYKYLNSSPGGISGIFIHEKYADDKKINRFGGWWGHKEDVRFKMEKGFVPMYGADGWQLSNVPAVNMAMHKASLKHFDKVGMKALREKSLRLTGYLEFLVDTFNSEKNAFKIEIFTPRNPEERGCQLSLFVPEIGKKVFNFLSENGVVADWREPNVIRVAPVPLYNSFEDCYRFYDCLKRYN